MIEITKVKTAVAEYSKEDLMQMDPELLRVLLRERIHHNIEEPLYPTLLKGKGKICKGKFSYKAYVFDRSG